MRLMQKPWLKKTLKRQNLSGLFPGGVKSEIRRRFYCVQNNLKFGEDDLFVQCIVPYGLMLIM